MTNDTTEIATTGHGPTHRPRTGRTTLHRDGTVTVWDCMRQGWVRTDSPSDTLLSTLGSEERERVLRHVGARAAAGWNAPEETREVVL